MIYSSIVSDFGNANDLLFILYVQTPTVYMTSTLDGDPEQTPIPFADRSSNIWGHGQNFGIWSCRFSADGKEIVAGGNGKIFGMICYVHYTT
jgi:hypothetical protein